jgi:NADH-quinone oxidoreductase subunit J
VVAQNIAFGILALASVVGAVKMVTTRNVVHAALYLVVVLASVGAQYILLVAEFVFAVQILVYVGAIVVLFLFGVMLTRARLGHEGELDNPTPQKVIAGATALGLLGVLIYVVIDAFDDQKLPEDIDVASQGTRAVGDAIFSTYLIPFEVVSVMLLAALIGAIILARRD